MLSGGHKARPYISKGNSSSCSKRKLGVFIQALVIPKIVYGELSLIFRDDKELNDFLKDTGIVIAEMKPVAYITAAKRWEKYNKRRVLICQRCGKKLGRLVCERCSAEIKIRQHVLTDFLIGAFALETKGRNIVTHDFGYYSSYFPELNIISSD